MKLDAAEQFARVFLFGLLAVCMSGLAVAMLSGCTPYDEVEMSHARDFGEKCGASTQTYTACKRMCWDEFAEILLSPGDAYETCVAFSRDALLRSPR